METITFTLKKTTCLNGFLEITQASVFVAYTKTKRIISFMVIVGPTQDDLWLVKENIFLAISQKDHLFKKQTNAFS